MSDSFSNYFESQIFSNRSKHNFLLTQNTEVYCWGKNDDGQLGLGNTITTHTPTLFSLPNQEKIILISCGELNSMCLTENHLVYVWGANNYGQLGLGDRTNRSTPTLLTLPNNEKASFVRCGGYDFSLCLTENNLCYTWGFNRDGQLGFGDENIRSNPTLLTLPKQERISFITCGYSHVLCLTENNLCYVWGFNYYGQLGLGHKNNVSSPALLSLPDNERISFIACGYGHTLCLTENNLCYAWGWNNYGQLGLGHTNDCSTPTLLTLEDDKIFFINCGESHTSCTTVHNLCYIWGYNSYGQLGFGHTSTVNKPTLVVLPQNQSISFLVCGGYHCLALTSKNLLYSWGYNGNGQCGLGNNQRNVHFPKLIESIIS